MAKDLLFEIGTEEIPARFMPGALTQFADLARKALADRRIAYGTLKTMGTPRRLALIVTDVAEEQADQTTKKKGPSLKLAYDAAMAGGSMPTVYNAANEKAVGLFLQRRIDFLTIPEMIEAAMAEHSVIDEPNVDEILATEATTYEMIESRWHF